MVHQIEVIVQKYDCNEKLFKDRVMLEPAEDDEYWKYLSVWVADFVKNLKNGERLTFVVHPYTPDLPFL